MKYTVKVEEMLKRFVVVEADSPEDAQDKVSNVYECGGIELDYDDFDSGSIETTREASDFDMKYFEEIEVEEE